MSISPIVSVIVPVYKVEAYLRRCVDSILAQTFGGFELILVDDGSPDRCGEICDAYAAEDSRITVIHKPNGGLSSARNAGIEKVIAEKKSEWITFIDSDDSVTPDYLEALFDAVSSTGLSVAIGGVMAVDNNNAIIYEQYEREERVLSPEELTVRFTSLGTWAWAKLYRLEDFVNIRYPEGKLYEDRHTTHLVTYKYEKLAMVNRPIYLYYHDRPGNIVSNNGRAYKNTLDRISGFRHQLDFFMANGYHRSAASIAFLLLNWLVKSLKFEFSSNEKHHLRRELRFCWEKYCWKYCRNSSSRRRYREALYGRCLGWFWLVERIERLGGQIWRKANGLGHCGVR